jgi:hypothetical protein
MSPLKRLEDCTRAWCLRWSVSPSSIHYFLECMDGRWIDYPCITQMSRRLAGTSSLELCIYVEIAHTLKKRSIFLAGSFSGLVNAFFSCPMELIKIRLQNQGLNGAKHLYTGPLDCATKIVKSMGLKGLYRGFGTTLIRETPSYGGEILFHSQTRGVNLLCS